MAHRAFDIRYPEIRQTVERAQPRSILDIGPAGGGFARSLSDLAPVTAIDVRDHRWDPHPNVDWQVRALDADAIGKLPPYDVVLALSVLHHMSDWRDALREIRKLARRLVIVEVPHPDERLTTPAARNELGDLYAEVIRATIDTLAVSPSTRQPDEFSRLTQAVAPLIVGTVTDGGGYHAGTQQRIGDAFEQVLGYRPYPGSLNVRTDRILELVNPEAQVVDADRGGRIFRLWPCRLRGVPAPCHLMTWRTPPARPVLEVLSPVRLRDHLDGDEVEIEVLAC